MGHPVVLMKYISFQLMVIFPFKFAPRRRRIVRQSGERGAGDERRLGRDGRGGDDGAQLVHQPILLSVVSMIKDTGK